LSRSRWVALIVLALAFFAPAAGKAAHTPPHLYECAPKYPNAADPPPQPDLPPEVEAEMQRAIASEEFEPLCPAGEVPQPTKTKAPRKLNPPLGGQAKAGKVPTGKVRVRAAQPSRVRPERKRNHHPGQRASISRENHGTSYWYSYAGGRQYVNVSKGVNGLFVQQTNEQPYIPTWENEAGAHSLGQLWAIYEPGPGCNSTAETGWSESEGQFEDFNPHLFIAAFDCGHFRGYACKACSNWVQSSSVAFPNMTVSHNDTFHVYGARMDGNNWWFYYDGQWVGYIPHSVWVYTFPYALNRLEAGGEVATPEYYTCADMGYGALFGSHPWAAMFSSVWYEYNYNTQSASAYMPYRLDSDKEAYSSGNWSTSNNQFRYGGPGWC
jgi:Neprosin